MFFDESTKNLNENYIGIQTSSLFLYEAEYRDYLDTKISNQNNIFRSIAKYTGVNESSVVMLEAVGDKIKSKWNKLVEFVKTIFAKFMESITHILLDEKAYLEKYKDIILKKPPKSDMKYSYTGDYKVGIDRLINTELPLFNYQTMAESLRKEGDLPAIQEIILKGQSYDYDADQSVATNFKNYFIAADKGESYGTFDQLKMVDLYNFCINFKKMEDVVKKDQTRLTNSSNAIQNAMNEEIRKANNELKNTTGKNIANDKPKSTTDSTEKVDNENNKVEVTSSTPKEESALYYFSEKVEVTNSNATKSMNTYGSNAKNDNAENNASGAAQELVDDDNKMRSAEDAEKEIDAMVTKWTGICRNLIGAKLTAVETIAKDYMEIIRAHVRSYGGQDLKKVDDRTEKATNYQKRSATENKETNDQAEGK